MWPLSDRQPAAPRHKMPSRRRCRFSAFMCLWPKSLLITFTSVPPPAAERNYFTRPLGLFPTLLSAREGEHAAKLMTVFTSPDAFHLFCFGFFWVFFLSFWLMKLFSSMLLKENNHKRQWQWNFKKKIWFLVYVSLCFYLLCPSSLLFY